MEEVLKPSESLRKKLLEEELKLRKTQPPHWAKTKYRKYALLRISQEKEELGKKLKKKKRKSKRMAGKKLKRRAKNRKKKR